MVWRAISHQFFVILGRLGDAQEHDFGKEFYLFFLFRDNAGDSDCNDLLSFWKRERCSMNYDTRYVHKNGFDDIVNGQ